MTNEELKALPIGTHVVRKTKHKQTEWIKFQDGREPQWAWFRRVFADGSINTISGILHAEEIEVKDGNSK